jgi:hypothetical protein
MEVLIGYKEITGEYSCLTGGAQDSIGNVIGAADVSP